MGVCLESTKRTIIRVAAVLILALGVTRSLLAGPDAAGSGNAPLRIVVDIPMPGPAVRFDYQSLDQDQGRLYISHMNADQLVVFDTTTRQVGGWVKLSVPAPRKEVMQPRLGTRGRLRETVGRNSDATFRSNHFGYGRRGGNPTLLVLWLRNA